MGTLYTKHFGEIEYDDGKVITFPQGLPGFPDATRFVLFMGDVPEALFFWLQSLDDSDLAFTLIDVYQLMPDYNPLVNPDELADLGDLSGSPLEIYNIAVIPDEIQQMRVNLMAPIVINPLTRLGKQVIVSNEEYKVKHYIFDDISKAKARQGQAGE